MSKRDEAEAAAAPAGPKAPVLPIVMLLDVSGSMAASGALDVVNRAVTGCFETIRANPRARDRADVALVAFAGGARVVQPFTRPVPSSPPTLEARHGGLPEGTDIGAAVLCGLDALRERREWYKAASVPARRTSVLVLLTDGMSRVRVKTPEFDARQRQAVEACRAAAADPRAPLAVLAVGVGPHASEAELEGYAAGGKLYKCPTGELAGFLGELGRHLVEVSMEVVPATGPRPGMEIHLVSPVPLAPADGGTVRPAPPPALPDDFPRFH